MEQHIGPSFKKIKAYIYHKDKNGFYVYAKPNLCDPNTVIKYIGRYLGRPVIALKRIDSYDSRLLPAPFPSCSEDRIKDHIQKIKECPVSIS